MSYPTNTMMQEAGLTPWQRLVALVGYLFRTLGERLWGRAAPVDEDLGREAFEDDFGMSQFEEVELTDDPLYGGAAYDSTDPQGGRATRDPRGYPQF